MEMETPRLYRQSSHLKWTITIFLFLISLGFGVAALMSLKHYDISHEKTVHYYLGNEAEGGMEIPRLYSQLLQTAHVHSFVMPLVFLAIWVGLNWVPLRSSYKKTLVLGGGFAILIYNVAPFAVRYISPKFVWLFTIGGAGLFLFYFIPAILVFYEVWWGRAD